MATAAGTLSNGSSALSSTYTFPALANKVRPSKGAPVAVRPASAKAACNGTAKPVQRVRLRLRLRLQVGYVVTEGFYWTIDSTPAFNTLVFDQAAGTSTLVTAGDVVVFNSRAFSASSPAVTQTAVQVFVPSGYLRLRIITKVSNPQGAVRFRWLVS